MKPQPYILGLVLVGLSTVSILSYLYIKKTPEESKEEPEESKEEPEEDDKESKEENKH